MSALSKLVVLIPVIAKADSMTADETNAYREEVLQRYLNPGTYIQRTESMSGLTIDRFT